MRAFFKMHLVNARHFHCSDCVKTIQDLEKSLRESLFTAMPCLSQSFLPQLCEKVFSRIQCFYSVCGVRVMSAACLVRLGRCSVLLQKIVGPFQQHNNLQFTGFRRPLYTPSEKRHSSTRFDADSSGRPTTWDSFGIWDNRIDEPILLPSSIRYGKPIPKVSLSKVGCASLIGQRKENEDRFQVSQLTDNILYFAVFDGHGGPEAADFCEKYMEKFIK